MISITLLGNGNVAQNLFEAFQKSDSINVVQVVGRTIDKLNYFKGRTSLATYKDDLLPADIYVLAITDDVILDVSNDLKVNGLLVHTSGAVPLSSLNKHNRIGVFYPLQTFTTGKILDLSTVPICIEANNNEDLQLLHRLGNLLGNRVTTMDSSKRKALHVAAVFVNNFTNFMYTIGEQVCSESDIDFSLLNPLIQETAKKIESTSPKLVQTGPAKRGDQQTLHAHLTLLENKNQREIYTLLSNSIKAMYAEQKGEPI